MNAEQADFKGDQCRRQSEPPPSRNCRVALSRHIIGSLLLLALALACSGCQTFGLTEEQWERQQRGGVADPETGGIVGALGTLGYLGALGVGAHQALK